MADKQSNVTLVWAHTPQRYIAFRNLHMAGIDFGVREDLAGMCPDEIAETLTRQGLSKQVIGEFKLLMSGIPVGSFIVSSIPNFRDPQSRPWLIGEVIGGYKYRSDLSDDPHTIQVQWCEQQFTLDEIVEKIGVNPSGRRLAVQRLNGAVFTPQPDLEEDIG